MNKIIKSNTKSNIINFTLLIIFIFSLVLYIINKSIKKNNQIKEDYVTYFLPFYNPNLDLLSNFYLNNDNNKNYVKKYFNYKQLIFTSDSINSGFLKTLASNFIADSNVVNVQIKVNDNTASVLDDLDNNKINFSINSITNLVYYRDILKKDLYNIRLVNYLYKEYLYFFTKKKYGFISIDNIPTKSKIGILKSPNPINFLYQKLLGDLGFKENTDYIIVQYDTIEDLFYKFRDDDCQMIIILDVFPNKKIYKLLDEIAGDEVILIPFNIYNEKLYLRKNYYLKIDNIDLNELSASFLPKSFGKYSYNIYKPDFKCCSIQKILLTNIQTDYEYIYSLSKFLGENYRDINNSIQYKAYNINPINLDTQYTQILQFHPATLKYFKEKGYVGYYNHPNCMYLAGTAECTEKSLKDNNLFYSIM
jgi:hypothetical protein